MVTTKPGSATIPFPGIEAALADGAGQEITVGGGSLVITSPWPGMLRTLYGDDPDGMDGIPPSPPTAPA